MSNGAKAGCVSSQSMVPNCLGNGLLYNVTICLLSSMLEFRRLVPLTVSSLSCVGLIHIVVCRDASGCFVVYLGLKTAHIPMEAPTEIGASIREKGRSGKYFIYSVRVLAFSLTTSTASTVLASSSETSPAASLASSCSTISACIFSLIFTLKVNTSRLSTIRTSGA